jgi:hypothetical protein
VTASQFANKHGIYQGRRSTGIHVALYRRTGGKLGGHFPTGPQRGSASWTEVAASPESLGPW